MARWAAVRASCAFVFLVAVLVCGRVVVVFPAVCLLAVAFQAVGLLLLGPQVPGLHGEDQHQKQTEQVYAEVPRPEGREERTSLVH